MTDQAPLVNVADQTVDPIDGQDALHQAILNGTHSFEAGTTVQGLDPDGKPAEIPAEQVKWAITNGYSVKTPTQAAVDQAVEENKGWKGAVKVAAKSFGNQLLLGVPGTIYEHTADPLEVAKSEAVSKDHDLANIVGNVGGFAGSMLTAGPLFKGAGVAGEAATEAIASRIAAAGAGEVGKRTAKNVAKEIVANLAAKGAGGAVEGAIIAAPNALTEAALGDPDSAAETLVAGVGVGTLFGGGGALSKDLFKLGSAAVQRGRAALTDAGEAAVPAMVKGLEGATGVPAKNIMEYAANPERINNAPLREDLEHLVDTHVAEERALRDAAEQRYAEARQDLRDGSKSLFAEKVSDKTDVEAVQKAMQTVNDQKAALGSLSEQAEDELLRSGMTLKRSKIEKLIDDQIDGLRVGARGVPEHLMNDLLEEYGPEALKNFENNGAIVGETKKAAAAYLEGLKRDVQQLPDTLYGKEVRDIVRGLRMDAQGSFDRGAGMFDSVKERLIKGISEPLSNELKEQVPNYAVYMDRMNSISKNLKKAAPLFRDEKTAANTLNRLFTDKGTFDRQVVDQLEQLTGSDLTSSLERYREKQALLDLKKRGVNLEEHLMPAQAAKVKQLEQELKAAEDRWAEVSRLTPNRTQSIIRNQGFKNANNKDRAALEALGNRKGVDLNQLISDRNTLDAFSKHSTNGSRKAMIGYAMGHALAGPIGGAVGAAMGGLADNYAGTWLKKLIDLNKDRSGLLFAEKAMKRAAEKIDGIPGVLTRMSDKAGLPKARTVGIAGAMAVMNELLGGDERSGRTGSNVEHRVKDLEKLNEKASQLVANPAAASAQIAALTSKISSAGAPEIGAAMGQKMTLALNYLHASMPKAPRPNSPFAPKITFKPSDYDLSVFEQKAQVVADPFSVLSELEHGTLTRNHMEALKAVYPGIHSMILQKVHDAATKSEHPLSYKKRVKLSLLMDSAFDSSLAPSGIAFYQQTFAGAPTSEEGPAPQPAAGGRPFKAKVNFSNQLTSDADRIAGRRNA